MVEIHENSIHENGAVNYSLDEYKSKIEEILLKETNKFRLLADQQARVIIDEARQKADLILSQTQKKNAEYIGTGEQKAAEIVGDSYKKAEKIINESKQKAQSERDEIIAAGRNEARRIMSEAEEKAKSEAKSRVKSEAEKVINKAREESDSLVASARREASSIIAKGEKDAEQQSFDTIERLKKEADSLIKIEIEKCSTEARSQSNQLYTAAKNDTQKLINNIVENSRQVSVIIAESVKNTENIMSKARESVQAELDELSRHITGIKNNLEQITDTFIREKVNALNAAAPDNDPNPKGNFWLMLKGERSLTVNGENGYTRGKIEFKALAPYNAERMRLLKKSLTQVPGIKNLGESSSEEGILLRFELLEQLPIVDIIKSIIPIEKVEKEDNNLKLTYR